jgi:hypothetical protein
VSWFDYPLGGSLDQKQDVLDRLRPDAQFLIVNHPTKADSYAYEDFAKLTGYDALEVASKYGVWEDYWDAALSAGRPVWGVASDDGHASVEEGVGSHIGIGYLLIHSVERTGLGVLAALHAGRFHAVYTRDGKPGVALELCELEGDQLHVRVGERADLIRFYGQNGRLLRAEHNRAEAFYTVSPDDSYVRVEVQVLARKAMLYLNPLIRWDGVALPKPEARFRLEHGLLIAADVDFPVAGGDFGRHRIADAPQMLVARTQQHHQFIGAADRNCRFDHQKTRRHRARIRSIRLPGGRHCGSQV